MHTVNVDEITPGGAFLKAGKYPARLLSVEGSISKTKPGGKGGNPMIVASYVITGGACEGLEAKIWYTLTVSVKNGKKFAGGVIDAKKAFAAAGKPLPAGFAFPAVPAGDPSISEADKQRVADTAAQLYGKRLKGVDVMLMVTNEGELTDPETGAVRKDAEGNTLYSTRTTIIGTPTAPSAAPAAAATVNDFDFGDD